MKVVDAIAKVLKAEAWNTFLHIRLTPSSKQQPKSISGPSSSGRNVSGYTWQTQSAE